MPSATANEDKSARTTVILPEALSLNLDLYCLHTRLGRGEVIRQAVRDFLMRQDYKPDQLPQITHSWLPATNGTSSSKRRRATSR